MFNPHLDQWRQWHVPSPETPDLDVPLFVLIEHDVIDEHDVLANQPFVRHASLHRYDREPRILYWKLLDFDSETEEEILQQCYSVIAWRYASKVLVSETSIRDTMDPNALLSRFLDALQEWIAQGGFLPDDPREVGISPQRVRDLFFGKKPVT